ncbi:hypothetical protein C5167_007006 [Papaver somniferum]|uniref:Morc S5 domain-containing protein n=1 Tax=Papaver somniferum TaxID=3469 RepID=A0A4Y7JF44_PAPSO|nr:hypothetical protein C5167_007006 [Papaver somniferum]
MAESEFTVNIKQETTPIDSIKERNEEGDSKKSDVQVIDLDSSSGGSDSDDDDDDEDSDGDAQRSSSRVGGGGNNKRKKKKRRIDNRGVVLPLGFLDPLPSKDKDGAVPKPPATPKDVVVPKPPATPKDFVASKPPNTPKEVVVPKPKDVVMVQTCKQFWKAGDYDGGGGVVEDPFAFSTGILLLSLNCGMDHVRVHPKFLHSNATSHKWALGAFAELLDNSLDEVCNGATFVNIDMLHNIKDGSEMLLVEDDGGGMDPDKMRQCMSLGYSAKSKLANTIGQYGNGFKTSTMRLGADVIVFSRCRGKNGNSSTQSIGLLSYTFLRGTGKEDIVVPMLDYEKEGREWKELIRSSSSDWSRNVDTIVQWSPFASEADLLKQFNGIGEHGTRLIIYNLWEDDQGELELDFQSDPHDIQIRGVNRDEKKIEMAKKFPNSRHYLTYRHSLRSYASILYLRIPLRFRMVLRGKDIVHHNLINDMMLAQEITYRPQPGADGMLKDPNVVATVTMGFVKDAKDHIDVQGFSVYHKNRLIKPFWRVWNPSGSDGRGVIGVLEANFVEPAHDKQGFERTTVLARLEARLVQMQKTYWTTLCHKVGYSCRRNKKLVAAGDSSPDFLLRQSSKSTMGSTSCWEPVNGNGNMYGKGENGKPTSRFRPRSSSSEEDDSDSERPPGIRKKTKYQWQKSKDRSDINSSESDVIIQQLEAENSELKNSLSKMKESFLRDIDYERDRVKQLTTLLNGNGPTNTDPATLSRLRTENHELQDRMKKMEALFSRDLQSEKERCNLLQAKLKESEEKIVEMNKEQEAFIDIFAEERCRREKEEENLRSKLKDASNTIQELLDKVRQLEK